MKLLVVSNNCLSFNNNNGKVMKNYLSAFSNEELCNFYIANEKNNEEIASFNVTNHDAMKSFISLGILKGKGTNGNVSTNNGTSIKYSPFKHLIRYFVWNSGFWKSKKFKNFINEQKPNAVVNFLGNNPYLLRLSYKIAKKKHLPLILFIGEDYPLKDFDYISRREKMGVSFKLFHKKEIKNFNLAIGYSSLVIFNSKYIKDAYLEKYKIDNCEVIYHLSSQKPLERNSDSKVFLYAGNLGLGRVESLIEFANAINEIDSSYMLKVFGNASNEDVNRLKALNNVEYNSFVTNDELVKEYENAFALIHIEKSDVYNNKDLRFAFSTKIADMVCSSKPFLVYAPKELAFTKHILKYNKNCVATSLDELKQKLSLLVNGTKIDNSELIKIHKISNNALVKESIRKAIEN